MREITPAAIMETDKDFPSAGAAASVQLKKHHFSLQVKRKNGPSRARKQLYSGSLGESSPDRASLSCGRQLIWNASNLDSAAL